VTMNTDAAELRTWILNEIRELWRLSTTWKQSHSLRDVPPDDITIFEYPLVEEGHCGGEPVALETITRQLSTIAPIECFPWDNNLSRGSYYQHAVARLHVDKASLTGYLEMTFGPRHGRGYFCERGADGSFSMERRWVS
jgi:hypothetical protein